MKSSYGSYGAPLPGYGTSLVDRINLYLHFRRYFKLLAERWLLLIIFTSLGLGIGVWIAVTKPDVFASESTLMRAPKLSLAGGVEAQESGASLDSILTLMTTEAVVSRVMAKLQEGQENTNVMSRPTLRPEAGRGGMFKLRVVGTNFDSARRFAVAWANEFRDFRKQQRRAMVDSTGSQIQQQILLYERRLENASQALDDYKKKNNIASGQDAGFGARAKLDELIKRYESMQTELKLFENSDAAQLASQGLLGNPSTPGEATAGDRDSTQLTTRTDDESSATRTASANIREKPYLGGSRYAEIKANIRQLEGEMAAKAKTLKPKHPYMAELRAAIERQERAMQTELELVEEARVAQIAALKIRMAGYPDLIEETRQEVFASVDVRNQLGRLEEDERNVRLNLVQLKQQYESMGRVAGDEEEFLIVSSGMGDAQPVGPDRPKLILTGAASGLAVAIAIMFLLHKLDDRIENPEEIEAKLEEPILGQLPEVDKRHNTEGYLLLTRMKPHTMFAESLRGVRSALLLGPDGATKKMLAVTSAVPGDGKTTFTTNFAVTLANAGNRTLLIDADLRRGNIHNYFEQPLDGGLSEVLEGKLDVDQAIHETGVKNLWLMRAGERPGNPSELLLGAATRELVEKLRSRFDYVVFDCPPLTAIDDTFSIATHIDGLLFVVRAGRTSIRFAKMAVATIHQRGAPMVGLVVNGVPIDNPYYYYTTYYYASYYHRPLTPTDSVYPDSERRRGRREAPPVEAIEAPVVKTEPEDPGKGENKA